ncbi:hypothetical protein VPH35_043763 [Triticum aestivum]
MVQSVRRGMSKRRRQSEDQPGRSGTKQKKSLYLVLDDWHKGFIICKIDADSPDLSGPPVLRLLSLERGRAMRFAALGSNIIATSNIHAGTLFYDTDTAGLSIGPPVPDAPLGGSNTFLTSGAGDALFAFAFHLMERPVSFEAMTRPPMTGDDDLLPTDWAVCGTYSVDTRSSKWRRQGEWMLPFRGRGYFDAELDAWVGLHEDGYICSCQVASRSGGATTERPDWKMADEQRMWIPCHQLAKGEGATLTYMGNARFCLVDCVAGDGVEFQDAFGVAGGCVLHITTFRLRYDRKGKLRIVDRNTSSCPVSKHFTSLLWRFGCSALLEQVLE